MELTLPRVGALPLVGAYLHRGYRSLTWDLEASGRLGACRFDRLQVTADERAPWSGEARVHGRRFLLHERQDQRGYMPRGDWVGLTDKAHQLLSQEAARQLAGGRFNELWERAWQRKIEERCGGGVKAAAEARRVAAWWEAADVVTGELAAGALRMVPARTPLGQRPHEVRVVPSYSGERCWAPVSARLEYPSGELAGWMTDDGRVVPAAPALGQ